MDLKDRTCTCSTGNAKKLSTESIEQLLGALADWKVVDNHHLQKEYKFSSYLEGVDFVTQIANIAEEQDHHPRIVLDYKKVSVGIYTHVVDGLTDNDFILAAKYDAICQIGSEK